MENGSESEGDQHSVRSMRAYASSDLCSIEDGEGATNVQHTKDHIEEETEEKSSVQDKREEDMNNAAPHIEGYNPSVAASGPPTDLRSKQRGRLVWGFRSRRKARWVEEIDMERVKSTVTPFLDMLGLDKTDIAVEYFAKGSHHKLFTIRKASVPPGSEKEYVIRIGLAEYPWYKLESEVATLELVRLCTSIPVPRVYAHDSSDENPVGYEWSIMDKMAGKAYMDVEESISLEKKRELARTLADWADELSRLRFDKIGCIFRDSKKPASSKADFKLGPVVCNSYAFEWRLEYEFHRGPFASIEQYLRSFVEVGLHEVFDPRQRRRAKTASAADQYQKKLEERFGVAKSRSEREAERQRIQKHVKHLVKPPGDPEDSVDWSESVYYFRGCSSEEVFSIGARHCFELLSLLPKICPEELLEKGATCLVHWNMSNENVLVDDAGNGVGLIDWEKIVALPHRLMNPYPALMCYKEYRDTPPDSDSWAVYNQQMEAWETGQMRMEYRRRLKELGSPAFEACRNFTGADCDYDHPQERFDRLDKGDLRVLDLFVYNASRPGGPFGDIGEYLEKVKGRLGPGF